MGRGNYMFRTAGGEYVSTFYFNAAGDFEDEKKACIEMMREELAGELDGLPFAIRRRKVEQMMMESRLPVRVKDETVYEMLSYNVDDEIDNLAFEVAGTNGIPGFARLSRKERRHEEQYAAGYRESAVIIAESPNTLMCIGDNENIVAVGMVPAFSMDDFEDTEDSDDFRDDAEADLIQTRKRADAAYEITDKDIEDEAYKLARAQEERNFEERMELYRAEANAAMAKVHAFFGTQSIMVRSCAWTTSTLPQFDEIPEADRATYYY